MCLWGTLRMPERKVMRASLAAPSTGAAARRMRRRPSRVPAILVPPARGITLTARDTPSGVSRSHSAIVTVRVGLRLGSARPVEQNLVFALALFLLAYELERVAKSRNGRLERRLDFAA